MHPNKTRIHAGLIDCLITSATKNPTYREINIFFQIKLNFLLVGHTHEDIDAFFGVYSQYLDQHDIYTVDGKCATKPSRNIKENKMSAESSYGYTISQEVSWLLSNSLTTS